MCVSLGDAYQAHPSHEIDSSPATGRTTPGVTLTEHTSTTPESRPSPTEPTLTFADLGVDQPIVDALADVGIVHPFPIQEQAIPIALPGADLIGQARTGTGKTLAFGVTLLHHLAAPDGVLDQTEPRPRALVMCPTRELALQVSGDIETAGKRLSARVLTVYGGTAYEPQLDMLKSGVDVVVGTPGRLLDLLHRHALTLAAVQVLVLDEADEMLDLGFLPDVEKLIAATPANRQTMLFSATMPGPIMALARAHLRQPVHIRAESADESSTVPETHQLVYQAHELDKPTIVAKLLQAPGATRVMVFCKTKWAVDRLVTDLKERGFSATAIHGDLSQVMREKSLAKFRSGKAQVIIATDVAARGIDVAEVTHVVNYGCPDDDKTYLHRIGRTGRAGHDGIAVTLVDWSDVTRWRVISKALDLGLDQPIEAYSTTPQLLEELGIPAGTAARLTPAITHESDRQGGKPTIERPADREGRRDRGSRSGAKDGKGDRQPRGKQSRRTGEQNLREKDGETPGKETAGDEKRPQRHRRRGHGTKPGAAVQEAIAPHE